MMPHLQSPGWISGVGILNLGYVLPNKGNS